MGLKKDRVRELAKNFYVENFDATQQEVAELFSVTPKTLNYWKVQDKWEEARRDYHASPVKIKQLLQEELLSISQGNPPKLKADNIAKLMAALDRCERKLDPAVVAKVLKELDNFTAKVNPKFAVEAIVYNKQFLLHRISMEA